MDKSGSNKLNRREILKFLGSAGLGVSIAETYERLYNIPSLERAFRKEIEYWLSQYNSAKDMIDKLSNQLKQKEGEIISLKEKANYLENQYNSTTEEINKLNSTINKLDELERESTSDITYYREKMDEAIDNLKRTIEKYRALLGDERVAFESSTVKILEDLKVTQEKLQKVLPYFPLILKFDWEPTKVVNDKIYDINVTFEVASPLNSLKEVEVMLIPLEYWYFITNYGMREEDYDKAFPKEEVRSIKIEPRKLEEEMFSINFNDLKGGREYTVRVRVKDVAGIERIVEVKTPYIRQFENLGKELYDKGIMIGVSYSGWYKIDKDSWGNYKYKGEVLLGEYSSLDRTVVTKQIDLMTGYGINVIFIGWPPSWGEGRMDRVIENLINSDLGKQIHYSVLYGHGENLNLNDPTVINNISSQIKYLLQLIPNEVFLKFDNRSVIYFYDLPAYKGDIPTGIDKIRFNVKEATGKEIFIIADYAKFDAKDSLLPILKKLDGATVWAGHYDSKGYYGGLYDYEAWYTKRTLEWNNWLKEKISQGELPFTFVYIPSVIPEFDSRYVEWGDPNQVILPRDPDRFSRQLNLALSNSLPKKIIRVDTWDDWYESTIIEPSTRWLFDYLQIIKEIATSK